MNPPHDIADPLLSIKDVIARLRVSRTTLWRLQHEEGFPKPITFGRRLKRWRTSDIERFIVAASNQHSTAG